MNKGGDCGACALGGALGIEPAIVYSDFDSRGITNIWEMARCLRCSVSRGFADRILDSPVQIWNHPIAVASFGRPAWVDYLPWFNYVRMAIDAGYYGIAQVDFKEQGGPETDHWVLLCGARTKGAVVNEIITGDVLASCSVKGERWYEAREFLKNMGGHDVLFVRPIKEHP
jgi:hypothetical protein